MSIFKHAKISAVVTALLLAVSLSPLAVAPAANAATLDVASSSFSFRQTNRTLTGSPDTTVGGFATYTNITNANGISVDAKVTTLAVTNTTVSDYDADGSASTNLDAFQINQNVTTTGGKVTYKFEFFDHATGEPVILRNLSITSIDLDNPGRQYTEFSSFQSYKRSTDTKIFAYTTDESNQALPNGLVRFNQDRTLGTAAPSTNDPFAAVQVDFAQLSSFDVSFGNEANTGTGYYGLAFKTLCGYATGSGTTPLGNCATGASVSNPNNSAPTTSNTSLNYLNDGTTWTAIPSANFPYSDVDSNPFVQIKVTSLPASGSLQRFINGGWVDVAVNDVISAADISSGYVRFQGTGDASFGYQVYDGLLYSTGATVSLLGRPSAQTISFAQPNNKIVDFTDFASAATADSGLPVTLTSETAGVCAVSGLNIVKVTGASGTCTITASQPGSTSAPLTYAAAVSVTRSFQVTNLLGQTITLANPGDQAWSGSTFTVSPAVGPDAAALLPVTVVSLTSSVCTVTYTAPAASATVTVRATGSCQLRATQSGNVTYAAANPVVQSFNIASSGATVTFDANGGSGLMASQIASTATTLASNVFTKSGYVFGGWSSTANGSLAYADSASYPFISSTTLYAIWTAATSYTVTFDANGGSGSMSAQSASAASNLSANTLNRTGYTFGGWSSTANGSLAYADSASYPFTSSTTLYAIWAANTTPSSAPQAPSRPAAPTITVPSATTIGTSPVTLTPTNTAPGGIGHKCLVDPADNLCKQSVTLPGKGKFVLNSNGSVTFTAVLGWTGTATVQYRVTDDEGQSAEAPVTVTVVPPAAPSVTGGSGNTITTVPANVTPQVTGLGSICLIDPADNSCKQTVTIPGKGTFVLNSNGTVTFTAVAGFIGTVTVQLQITTAYGQVARGPVTFIVGPTSQLQTGATTGTAPVNLAPNTKPAPGSACLVDPNDDSCKNVVTIPEVGTWNLNPSTGGVTFKAVTGYVGTTIVQYRVKRAGFDPTQTPFVVTVAKKRPPVTVTIGGFNPGSPILTTAIKNQVAAFMKAYVGYKTVECIGFTMGPTVLSVDKWLSTTRASNACDYILGTLKSKLTALPLKNKMETNLGSHIRRITLTLRD